MAEKIVNIQDWKRERSTARSGESGTQSSQQISIVFAILHSAIKKLRMLGLSSAQIERALRVFAQEMADGRHD